MVCFGLIVCFLLLKKMIDEGFGIIHLLILFGLLFAVVHGLWMLFGFYEINLKKNQLVIKKVLIFSFYQKTISIRSIDKIEHIENYASIYGFGWGGLTFPLMFENAIRIYMNNKQKIVFYLPDKKTYVKISDFINKSIKT